MVKITKKGLVQVTLSSRGATLLCVCLGACVYCRLYDLCARVMYVMLLMVVMLVDVSLVVSLLVCC